MNIGVNLLRYQNIGIYLTQYEGIQSVWAEARARINFISPGVIITPLAYDEFTVTGDSYQQMIDASSACRAGTPEEIAAASAFLLSDEAAFITGTDSLSDGAPVSLVCVV